VTKLAVHESTMCFRFRTYFITHTYCMANNSCVSVLFALTATPLT